MKFKMFKCLPLLLVLSLSACVSTPKVFTDSDPMQDFAVYKTFTWTNESPMIYTGDEPVNPLVEQRLMDAIRVNLESKGYQFAVDPEAADFAVSFSVGARNKIKVDSNPAIFYVDDWRWGKPYYGPVSARTYTEGSLAIDAYDTARQTPVWHGVGARKLKKLDYENSSSTIPAGVDSILLSFPKR